MGALTNKLYAFQARQWEQQSINTIAINNTSYQMINVNISQRKIVRILPVVGIEEWIDDNVRFFKSDKNMQPPVVKICYNALTEWNKYINSENMTNQHKITAKEAINVTKLEILRNKNLSLILGNKVDAKLIESIRTLEDRNSILKITSNFRYTKNAPIDQYDDIDLEINTNVLTLTRIKQRFPLFYSQLENFKETNEELYTANVSEDINKSYLGNSRKFLLNMLEGEKHILMDPLLIVDTNFSCQIFLKKYFLQNFLYHKNIFKSCVNLFLNISGETSGLFIENLNKQLIGLPINYYSDNLIYTNNTTMLQAKQIKIVSSPIWQLFNI